MSMSMVRSGSPMSMPYSHATLRLSGALLMVISTTSKNTWYLQWRIEGHTNTTWTDMLQQNGLVAKAREFDRNVIGNVDMPKDVVAMLHNKGCAQWDRIALEGKLNRFKLNSVIGRLATNQEYNSMANEICDKGSIQIKKEHQDIISFEHKRRNIRRTNINPNKEANYYIHYPTKTLYMFMDGSCSNNTCRGGVYYGKKSQRNMSFSAHIAPHSTIAELLVIEEALMVCPANYNLHIITNSKAAIDILNGFETWTESKWNNTMVYSTVKCINAIKKELLASHSV